MINLTHFRIFFLVFVLFLKIYLDKILISPFIGHNKKSYLIDVGENFIAASLVWTYLPVLSKRDTFQQFYDVSCSWCEESNNDVQTSPPL